MPGIHRNNRSVSNWLKFMRAPRPPPAIDKYTLRLHLIFQFQLRIDKCELKRSMHTLSIFLSDTHLHLLLLVRIRTIVNARQFSHTTHSCTATMATDAIDEHLSMPSHSNGMHSERQPTSTIGYNLATLWIDGKKTSILGAPCLGICEYASASVWVRQLNSTPQLQFLVSPKTSIVLSKSNAYVIRFYS